MDLADKINERYNRKTGNQLIYREQVQVRGNFGKIKNNNYYYYSLLKDL